MSCAHKHVTTSGDCQFCGEILFTIVDGKEVWKTGDEEEKGDEE